MVKEKILLATGINENELLKSLAQNGVNTFGLRVFSLTSFAQEMMLRNGFINQYKILDRKDAAYIFYGFTKDIPYFENASLTDGENIASTILQLRLLIDEDDEEKTIKEKFSELTDFAEKNTALLTVYEKYKAYLHDNELYDSADILREAINRCSRIDCDFMILNELVPTPLEMKLMEKVSGGSYRKITLSELYNLENTEIKNLVFTSAYGTINEIEDIFDYIYTNKIPLDKCMLVCAAPQTYEKIIDDLTSQYAINVSFSSGTDSENSYPAKLFRLILDWMSNYYSIDSLNNFIFSDYFNTNKLREDIFEVSETDDRIFRAAIERAGSLRISFDADSNNIKLADYLSSLDQNDKNYQQQISIFECLSKIVEKFNQGFMPFFNNYAFYRTKMDESCAAVITDEYNRYISYNCPFRMDDLIKKCLGFRINPESSEPGKLYVTDLKKALAVNREYVFIAGLSADIFPGKNTENYLLLDDEMLFINKLSATSVRKIENNKELLDSLIRTSATLNHQVRLSYSFFDLSEIKGKNPSSVLFDYYLLVHKDATMKDFENNQRRALYFKTVELDKKVVERNISRNRKIAEAYVNGHRIIAEKNEHAENNASLNLNRDFSPSSLQKYLTCPRQFYYSDILYLDDIQEDDTFKIVTEIDFGIMVHAMMEYKARNNIGRAEFINKSEEMFNNYLKGRIPLNEILIDNEKKLFIQAVTNGFDNDPGNRVCNAEEEKRRVKHDGSGIFLRGIADRVEKLKGSDECIIVDYKTGKKVRHKENDFESCFQSIVYCYIMEKCKYKIAGSVFRYLRDYREINCDYNIEMKNNLSDFLNRFKDSMQNNSFEKNESNENCRYCPYKMICASEKKVESEGEDD